MRTIPGETLKLCPECFSEYQDDLETCLTDSTSLVPIEPDPLIGTKLQGRYRISGIMGRGGMGVVYKAEHEQMGRSVALKMLHLHMVTDADAIKRFHREAKAVSRVRHPHSIVLYDFGVTPAGQPFIVMDFIEGTNLKRVIKQEGPLSLERANHIFQQVVDALSCAHSEGVIHRDLKPENIMLTERAGDKDFVQVVDFGISKLKSRDDEEKNEYNITRIGDVCGSPPYMSPEQCMSATPIDFRSDIYALGVVLFESLSGRLPFKAKTAIEMIDSHLYAPPTPLKAANPDLVLCDSLNNVLMKALQKEPERRQQSMQELGRELAEAVRRDQIKVRSAQHRMSISGELAVQNQAASGAQGGASPDQTLVSSKTPTPLPSQVAAQTGQLTPEPMLKRAGAWFASLLRSRNKGTSQTGGLNLENCPYCASAVKPGVRYCLECGRNLPSGQELSRLRLAQGIFTLPRGKRPVQDALGFSTKARAATSRTSDPWGIPRLVLVVNLLLLLCWCYLYLLPKAQRAPTTQNQESAQMDKHHLKKKRGASSRTD